MMKLPEEPKSILIVKLSSIGDVIHSLPVASALRRRFPEARISWLVSRKAREILSGHPHLDQVIVVGGKKADGGIPITDINHPFVAARTLRASGFDVALDLQGLIRSSLFAFLSGAKVRIGYRSLKEAAFLFYNVRAITPTREMHVVDSYLRFAAILGAPVEPVEFRIATSEKHEAKIDELLSGAGVNSSDRLFAICPGSSWRAKTWPPERLARAAEHVSDKHGCRLVIIGSKADVPRAEKVLSVCRAPMIDLTGKTTLKELAVLLRRCVAMIGNDSGPTHLAAAVGKPVVAIYGPTDEKLLGPYGEQNISIVAPVPCRPCRRRSRAERCSHLRCLTEITPEQVCEAVDRILSRQSTEPSSAESAYSSR
jgi:heptosyltransferase-1